LLIKNTTLSKIVMQQTKSTDSHVPPTFPFSPDPFSFPTPSCDARTNYIAMTGEKSATGHGVVGQDERAWWGRWG